jgi:hypothetical protein
MNQQPVNYFYRAVTVVHRLVVHMKSSLRAEGCCTTGHSMHGADLLATYGSAITRRTIRSRRPGHIYSRLSNYGLPPAVEFFPLPGVRSRADPIHDESMCAKRVDFLTAGW